MKIFSFAAKAFGVAIITGAGAALGSILIGELFYSVFDRNPVK